MTLVFLGILRPLSLASARLSCSPRVSGGDQHLVQGSELPGLPGRRGSRSPVGNLWRDGGNFWLGAEGKPKGRKTGRVRDEELVGCDLRLLWRS